MITYASLEENKPLSELSTFRIGGPARFFLAVSSVEEMQEAMRFCSAEKLPFIMIGKGSNCLFDDGGFDGLAILNKIDFINSSEGLYTVGAGYSFSLLGSQTAKKGWAGLEFASGIPGTVGGAVYMNAGANGSETANVLAEVQFVDTSGELKRFKREELEFSYRTSPFQKMRGAVVSAVFSLTPCEQARQRQLDLIQYRLSSQPYTEPSAGCVFRNPSQGPSCPSAGALIEKAGLKGLVRGGAKISEKHANFIVNTGAATASDVMELIRLVKERVKNAAGVELEEEIRWIRSGKGDHV
jgi:UDP-N-acetylmuramate dehydrogenase